MESVSRSADIRVLVKHGLYDLTKSLFNYCLGERV